METRPTIQSQEPSYLPILREIFQGSEELPANEGLHIALRLLMRVGFEACIGDAMVLAFMGLKKDLEDSGQFKRKEVQDFFAKLVLLVDAKRKDNPMHKM